MKDRTLLSLNYDGAKWFLETDDPVMQGILDESGVTEENSVSGNLLKLVPFADHAVKTFEEAIAAELSQSLLSGSQ